MRVLGRVCLHGDRPVWDLQDCRGGVALTANGAEVVHTAVPEGVDTVWLPDALRPVSVALLRTFWGGSEGAVPSYDALMAVVVARLADRLAGPGEGEAAALARFLTCPEWAAALAPLLQSAAFRQAATAVVRGAGVAPRPENIFAAFNATPLSAVRVVVLGAAPATGAVELDSPLHNGARVTVPLAQGLAWSVPVGAPVPPAVLNVHAELAASYRDWAPPTPLHGSLERWTRQGVLLLATALAAPGEATAWAAFTDDVVRVISARCAGVVFLLCGAEAGQRARLIARPRHALVTAPHPSERGFVSCGCFVAVNAALARLGRPALRWQV
jgi:uracil-DNA glycosylase